MPWTTLEPVGPHPICVCSCGTYVRPTEQPITIPRGPTYRMGECPTCGNVYAVT